MAFVILVQCTNTIEAWYWTDSHSTMEIVKTECKGRLYVSPNLLRYEKELRADIAPLILSGSAISQLLSLM